MTVSTTNDLRGYSVYKNAPLSVKKTRHVANLVRGMNVLQAKAQLVHLRQKAAVHILKCLNSSVANYLALGGNLDQTSVQIVLGKGRVLKRLTYRAKGKADRILHKYTHITVIVTEKSFSGALAA